jgi:hypothetical protein
VNKHFLAYIFLAVFCIQLLPINELGKVLYGNQLIEEICHSVDTDGKTSDVNEDFKSSEYECEKHDTHVAFFTSSRLASKPLEKNYVSRLADDTRTRPPLEMLI